MYLNLFPSVDRREGGTCFGPVCRPPLLRYGQDLQTWCGGLFLRARPGVDTFRESLISARWSPKAREGMTLWTMQSRAKIGRNRIRADYTNDLEGSKVPRLPSMFVQYTKPQTLDKAKIKLAWEPLSPYGLDESER